LIKRISFHNEGQEYDPETGLYYYNARYYDPEIGRFLSADAMIPDPGNPQSFNRYSYVLNNPLRYTDPSGHVPDDTVNQGMKEAQEVQAKKAINEIKSKLEKIVKRDIKLTAVIFYIIKILDNYKDLEIRGADLKSALNDIEEIEEILKNENIKPILNNIELIKKVNESVELHLKKEISLKDIVKKLLYEINTLNIKKKAVIEIKKEKDEIEKKLGLSVKLHPEEITVKVRYITRKYKLKKILFYEKYYVIYLEWEKKVGEKIIKGIKKIRIKR